MTDSEMDDLERQLQESIAKLEELKKKKAELERIKLQQLHDEEQAKAAVKASEYTLHPMSITVYKYTVAELLLQRDTNRVDYSNQIRYDVPSYRQQGVHNDVISILDWDRFNKFVAKLSNITIHNKAASHIEYFLHGPHADIVWNEKDVKVTVHPTVSHFNIFKDLAGTIARLHADGTYHLPLNELYRLLKHSYSYSAGQDKYRWDKQSLDYALKDLERRKKLDDIALATDAPEYDMDMNGLRLKPYQRVAVQFAMLTKNEQGNIRILDADEMGLGKSPTALGIIKADGDRAKKIAIVCPATIKEKWRREVDKFLGEHAQEMKGVQPSNEDLRDILLSKHRFFIFNYDILSRPIVENKGQKDEKERYLWVEAFNTLGFTHVILDEAHKCKNMDSNRTKAILKATIPNVIELTGTPVTNRPLELFPALKLLNPEVFNNYEAFKARYTNGNYGVRNLSELREVLRPYMIRRLKKDVMKDLDPIIRTNEYVEMSVKERKVYDKMMEGILVNMDTLEEQDYINHILVKILKIKQFLSKVKAPHVAEHAKDIFDQAEPDDPYKKVLIFSQFIPVVKRIKRVLGSECLYITGEDFTPLQRQKVVDEFQNNKYIQFLVATPQSTSEGLDITAAGHVIFTDYTWTPAMHQQAEGRAYGRSNDPHSIEAHYFAVQDSLDDWLRGIIRQKLDTIEAIVDGVNEVRVSEDSIIKEMFKALKRGEIK